MLSPHGFPLVFRTPLAFLGQAKTEKKSPKGAFLEWLLAAVGESVGVVGNFGFFPLFGFNGFFLGEVGFR